MKLSASHTPQSQKVGREKL